MKKKISCIPEFKILGDPKVIQFYYNKTKLNRLIVFHSQQSMQI